MGAWVAAGFHRSPPPEQFVADSPLEEAGFEPLVPRELGDAIETALFAYCGVPVPRERPTLSLAVPSSKFRTRGETLSAEPSIVGRHSD